MLQPNANQTIGKVFPLVFLCWVQILELIDLSDGVAGIQINREKKEPS